MNNANEKNELFRKNNLPQTCRTCLYCDHIAADGGDHCVRFARFVDHRLHEASRDCNYWSPVLSPP